MRHLFIHRCHQFQFLDLVEHSLVAIQYHLDKVNYRVDDPSSRVEVCYYLSNK